jgi:hypothetical protein
MAQTKTKASAKRSGGSKKPQARSRGSTKATKVASKATDKATTAVGNATGKATHAVGKAKVPLVAGGAALAGAAGGMALGARQARRNRHGLAKAAKGVGVFGARVGHLAAEMQRNREATNGGTQHRSPLEVVLEGLTARRDRA